MTADEFEKHYSRDRHNSNSYKWDAMYTKFGTNDLIPLWVADMDFSAPECVKDRFCQIIDYGIYGYYIPPESYYDAIISWEEKKHNYSIKKEWLRYLSGVVPGIYWFINILTKPSEHVLILTPSYYPFMEAVNNTGRQLVTCELINTEGQYSIDYEKFENCIIANDVKAFVLCSPHNPTGRVWKVEELQKMLDICVCHKVYVISDEIHQDIVSPGFIHHPSATTGNYNEYLVTLTAASKTFSIAGLKNAYCIIPSETIRNKFDAYVSTIQQLNKGAIFGYAAVEAVYSEGEDWLKNVLEIIDNNYHYIVNTLRKKAPKAIITPLEGTYLVWIDLGAYIKSDDLEDFIIRKCGIAVDFGKWFYPNNSSDTHIRINVATPRKNIHDSINKLTDELIKLSQ